MSKSDMDTIQDFVSVPIGSTIPRWSLVSSQVAVLMVLRDGASHRAHQAAIRRPIMLAGTGTRRGPAMLA